MLFVSVSAERATSLSVCAVGSNCYCKQCKCTPKVPVRTRLNNKPRNIPNKSNFHSLEQMRKRNLVGGKNVLHHTFFCHKFAI